MADFDLVVLGAGPGGYVAAIRASQLGLKTAVVESKYWGGVCLNVGCIPSKALLRNAELAHIITHEKDTFGIEGDARMSFQPTHARSRQVSDKIVKGVHFLMKKNKIAEIHGWGTLTGPKSMDVAMNDGSRQSLTFDNLIIATGATTRLIPGTSLSDRVVTYEEQILTDQLPGSIVIAGSGAIGVEFAYVMKNFGVDVTIVEFLDRMVPTEDAEVSKELLRHYKKLGVTVLLSTKVESIDDSGEKVRVTVSPAAGGESRVIETDKVLQAIGFAPRLDGYGLEATGVATERGAITVDEHLRTSAEGVYAIGDATGISMLAHTASHQGEVAVSNALGEKRISADYTAIPACVYTDPEIAYVGLSEAQARARGEDVRVGQFPFSALGRAMVLGETDGVVRVVTDGDGYLLGVTIMGPRATDLIAEAALALNVGITAAELSHVVHAHPTLPEAIAEAALDVDGRAVHIAPRRR